MIFKLFTQLTNLFTQYPLKAAIFLLTTVINNSTAFFVSFMYHLKQNHQWNNMY